MTFPEAGKVIENMKGSPGLLSVIILQLATLAVIYFVATATADRQQVRELALIEACHVGRT